jgi:hypothetical protein
MREKIAAYLERAGRPLPAEQILREVLNVLSPNSFAAERVLKGILGSDPRFHRSRGLWRLTARPALRLAETAALYLQWSASLPRCFRGAIHLCETGPFFEFQHTTEVSGSRDSGSLREARLQAENRLLLVWSGRELRLWNHLLRSVGLPEWKGESLALSKLAARALPQAPRCRNLEDLAPLLDLPPPDAERPSSMARFLGLAFQSLIDLVPASSRGSLVGLERWIAEGSVTVDFSRFAFGRDLLARIPESPGVYLMRDRTGEVIYVGKAGNLRRRVRSYFTPLALKDAKVARIHSQLYSLQFLTCANEVEALLLEMRMIRDFRPLINLQAEIHEQPARYGHACNLLLLVPSGRSAEVYFLKDGAFAARHTALLGRAPSKRLQDKIRTVYFAPRRRKSAKAEEWETEIVSRWLAAHRKHLNLVDVDEAGGRAAVLRRLASYLRDPDRLTRKVYYR